MSNQGFRLARRFSAATDPEKIQKLLLSLRKAQGYLTGLTWSQLGDILNVFDPKWTLEKITGFAKTFTDERDADYTTLNKETADRMYAELSKSAVTSLPSTAKVGQLYVLDLGNVQEIREGFFRIRCKPWMGSEGWRITTHTGKSFEFFPDRYMMGELKDGLKAKSRGKILVYEALSLLKKETDWLDQINKALNMEAHVPAAQRTRDSTGSCGVCFQNVKITNGRDIVLHGYKRPGTGYTHGECFGTRYPAFELAVDGTRAYLETQLRRQLNTATKYHESLQNGTLKEFTVQRSFGQPKVFKQGDPEWERELRSETERAETAVKLLTVDVKAYEKLVSNWKPRPLPKEGEAHIDWYSRGQTD